MSQSLVRVTLEFERPPGSRGLNLKGLGDLASSYGYTRDGFVLTSVETVKRLSGSEYLRIELEAR